MKNNILTLTALLLAPLASLHVSAATVDGFGFGWKFAKGDQQAAIAPNFDDSKWEHVDLPHDWAISGPFGPLDEGGSTGKLPWSGEGWYRKQFELPETAKGQRVQLLFDGVMASPKVYLNGKEVGSWIYGYNSFSIDATDAAEFGKTNVLTVHADTRNHKSRWYPGAGIYRKVTLRLVSPIHIPIWGVFVTTPLVRKDMAQVHTQVDVSNTSAESRSVGVEVAILDAKGKEVSKETSALTIAAGEVAVSTLKAKIPNPALWDIEHPHLYTAVTRLVVDGREIQREETTFGIRTITFTADEGFHLNGRRVQLKGVNLHHDQGPLGAAFFPRAMERQLQIMKEMGVNAIRTSHNPSAPELLELCDRMGFVVWNELFDKYGPTAGVKCGIDEYVKNYAERETKNFILRDRNHASVVLWSIGNEIADLKKEHVDAMVGYFKKYDTTRQTTLGCNIPGIATSRIIDALDTSGWNYSRKYMTARKIYPKKPIIYSESASAFGTRGAYKLTLPKKKTDYGNDGELTAYSLTSARWSDISEIEFERMRKDTFVAGEFVWTGIDYLGEPTPYNHARSSYFGIVDLAGLPKDSYYLYRSHWLPESPTVHLAPHWNWQGHEGKAVPVFVYTSGDEAELFLNGKSLGRKKKGSDDRLDVANREVEVLERDVKTEDPYFKIVDNYRLRWLEVPYEAGELKAVAYQKGKKLGEAVVKTAGAGTKLKLTADRSQLKADGMDLCYVTVEMTDEDGNLCPLAMDKLTFTVGGAARLSGVDNGNQMGHDSFTDSTHPLFYGKAVAVLRNIPEKSGKAVLNVKTDGGIEEAVALKFE
jgi:beta-galactosidase